MTVDAETLLQPVSETEPAGPDLSYDRDFRRIARELDEVSQKDRPGGDPVVAPAIATAIGLLERSKDLWIASHGICFALYAGDFATAVVLLETMAGIAERFWETCYPALDGGSDPAGGRREACRQLVSIGRALRHLERLDLPPLKSKGRISFRDIAGGGAVTAKGADILGQLPEPIRHAVDDSALGDWQSFSASLAALLAASRRLSEAFSAPVPGQGPDLGPLDGLVSRMQSFSDAVIAGKDPSAAQAPAAASVDAPPAGDLPPDGGTIRPPPLASGPIRSRAQALAQLDAVKNFFQATEPSSPLPLLIERLKRLAGMGFMEMVQNLAPSGFDEASRVLEPPPPETPPEQS